MADTHDNHSHQHGPGCGHTGILHEGHVDYLHDGHLHHHGAGGVEEHRLEVGTANPGACTPAHRCGGHEKAHKHGPGCGHEHAPGESGGHHPTSGGSGGEAAIQASPFSLALAPAVAMP